MDRDKTRQFLERFTSLAAGATTIGLLAVADRSGLLRSMAGEPPRALPVVADSAGLNARYTEEILSGLVAASIIDYDAENQTFFLSEEHAAVIADDESPYSMTGWLDMIPTALEHTDAISDAARSGGGIAFEDFGERMVRGIDRGNTPSMTVLLTRRWLPEMPDVVDMLKRGARVADFGCGSGGAVRAMAKAYSHSAIFGFDISSSSIERARKQTAEPNATFIVGGSETLQRGRPFDLVTLFDVVHDLADPIAALTDIRSSLGDGGVVLMMEPRIERSLENNINDRAALLYGISTFHCMTQSLAAGGPGLGAAWGRDAAEKLCGVAGFSSFEELPIDNPFSTFYRVS
ncbi:MAG: class I SAM-dependent methyltransferase [Actinomycetota bacterium]|nr:class I SAM-dependent methyltransferase [Actinomycetota bacterium]